MLAKKTWITISLAIILAVSFVQLPNAYSAQTSDSANRVLVFLKDVVMIDVEKYDAVDSIGPLVDNQQFGGIPYTSGKLALNSETSIIDVLYNFVGDSLTSCTVEPVYGSAKYLQPLSANLADAASTFLQKYQVYADDSSIAAIKDTLSGVDATKNTTKTIGDIQLKISNTELGTSFTWERTYNGAVYPGLGIGFKDGAFYSFGQDLSYYTIGNTDVKITKDQAIDIALKRAESFSYTYQDTKIENFNILKDSIVAELEVKSRYKPFELYPLWKVDLPLDDVYPGSVYFIRVNLWADTGEIINIRPLGGGGYVPSGVSASDETQSGNSAALPPTMAIIAIAAVILIIIAVAVVVLRKRSK